MGSCRNRFCASCSVKHARSLTVQVDRCRRFRLSDSLCEKLFEALRLGSELILHFDLNKCLNFKPPREGLPQAGSKRREG